MKVLGIETSCDETSIAVLDEKCIVAAETYSQDVHAAYGGVVPEMASRAHLQKIDVLCRSVFDKNGIDPRQLSLIAVTDSPGLAGALLVGIGFALGLHCGYGTAITGINHVEGHICSIFLEYPDIPLPFLALAVSGGHTSIYRVDDFGIYTCLGRTVDDAAGEAFDKIGTMLGFTYPAGRAIEQEAQKAASEQHIAFPVARAGAGQLNFSFSGLKTAVKYFMQGKDSLWIDEHRALICASFQKAIVDALVENMYAATRQTAITAVAVVGGVACNGYLRQRMMAACGPAVFFPSPSLCTDNAAMIAKAGLERGKRNLLRFPHMAPSAEI